MHLNKLAVWWSSLLVGLICCAFAYWGVTATLAPIQPPANLPAMQSDPAWEVWGAIVAVVGGLLGIGTETKDRDLPLGIAPQGLWAGAILVVGLIFTYAKAEHDRREHETQERQLATQMALMLSADEKASKLLTDMTNVNESLKTSEQAIRGSVTAVQDALGTDEKTGLRGQITKMRDAALTADDIAKRVAPKIATEISEKAAPLIAKQFVLPDAQDIAGKIKLPSATDIASKVEVPNATTIAKAIIDAHPQHAADLANALVSAGFRPPSATELVTALKAADAIPPKQDLVNATAAGLLNDLVPMIKNGLGRQLAATLVASPDVCDAMVEQIRSVMPVDQRKRIAQQLGT